MDFFKLALRSQLAFWTFSTVMFILGNDEKWFSRLSMASLYLCTLAIIKAIEQNKGEK